MIADLKPYGDYKDSGLPWLGHVPKHWDTRPAFGAFTPIHERNRGMKERTVLSLSYGRIIVKPAEKLHGLVPESFETYQILNPGDIVLRTTDLQNDHRSLRVGMVRDRGIITSAYLALRVNAGVRPEFGFQFLNVWDTSKAIYGYGSGLRQNLDFSHFKRMPVPLPPPDEQAAIVRFLDWANGRLERAIRAKRKVIALLNEQKQAIIHRAVTRGLDPSVPLKPSGIPWLGDIPKHWEVRKIRAVAARVTKGTTPTTLGKQFVESGIRFVKVESIGAERTILEAKCAFIDDATDRLLSRSRLRAHDVVVSIAGAIGRPAVVAPYLLPANTNQAVGIISALAHLCRPEWLAYILASPMCLRAMADASVQSAQANLSLANLGRTAIPLPSVSEQDSILASLFRETAGISAATSRLEREIELLREYRTRHVADVVTGKLDVRDAAARLPEEAIADTVADEIDLGDEAEVADEEVAI